jgi:molecular chaperone GrpE
MDIFGKKKMIDKKELIEEFEDTPQVEVRDRRRFDADGERVKVKAKNKEEAPSEVPARPDAKTAREIELETNLKSETERRIAAETKLQEVQRRFDEAKRSLEKETSEMRERMRKTLTDQARQQQAGFLATIIPVLDNLNLAMEHAEKDASLEHLLDGVRSTARSFENALRETGVEVVSSVGEKFNPEIHEAVDTVPVEEEKDGLVTAEFQTGYTFGERLLRPAKVQVGRSR